MHGCAQFLFLPYDDQGADSSAAGEQEGEEGADAEFADAQEEGEGFEDARASFQARSAAGAAGSSGSGGQAWQAGAAGARSSTEGRASGSGAQLQRLQAAGASNSSAYSAPGGKKAAPGSGTSVLRSTLESHFPPALTQWLLNEMAVTRVWDDATKGGKKKGAGLPSRPTYDIARLRQAAASGTLTVSALAQPDPPAAAPVVSAPAPAMDGAGRESSHCHYGTAQILARLAADPSPLWPVGAAPAK
jgi:hypothetical protein